MKYSNSNNFDLGIDLSFDRWLANPTKFMDEVQAEIDEKVQRTAKKKAEERQQQYIAYQKAVAEMKEYAARKQQEADNFYLQHPEEIAGGGSFSFANEPLTVPSALNTSSENITEIDSSPKMSRKEARLIADTEKANELGITVEELRSQRAKAAHQTAELNAKIRAAEMGMTVDQYKEYRKKINRDNRDSREANKLGITVEELRQQKEKEKEKKKAERQTTKATTETKPRAKKNIMTDFAGNEIPVGESSQKERMRTKGKPTIVERVRAFTKQLKNDEEALRQEIERYARNIMWDALFSKTNNEYSSADVYLMLQDIGQVGDDKALGDALRDAIDNKIDYDSLVALTHEVAEKKLGDAYDAKIIQDYLDRIYNEYTAPGATKQTSFNHPADENEPTTEDEQDALNEFMNMTGGRF